MSKSSGLIAEFKKFIARGNVMDMAVGVVIGGAFTAIVNAVVGDIINPIISVITGGIDFSGVTIGIFPIGDLIMAVINFLLIALVVFTMVKALNRFHKKEESAPAAPPAPTKEELLLSEIRDLLREQNRK
jgi:large conductance mechanosensitive channel protein